MSKLIVKKAAVLGAGVMGAQIAAHFANAGVPVLLNPGPAKPLPECLWPQIDILVPNESEAELLSGLAVTCKADTSDPERPRTVCLTLENNFLRR